MGISWAGSGVRVVVLGRWVGGGGMVAINAQKMCWLVLPDVRHSSGVREEIECIVFTDESGTLVPPLKSAASAPVTSTALPAPAASAFSHPHDRAGLEGANDVGDVTQGQGGPGHRALHIGGGLCLQAFLPLEEKEGWGRGRRWGRAAIWSGGHADGNW